MHVFRSVKREGVLRNTALIHDQKHSCNKNVRSLLMWRVEMMFWSSTRNCSALESLFRPEVEADGSRELGVSEERCRRAAQVKVSLCDFFGFWLTVGEAPE